MFTRATALIVIETVVLVAAIVVAALVVRRPTGSRSRSSLVLLVLALATDLFAVSLGGQRISGSFLALVLAAALLGPAPATAIGIAAVLFDQARARNPLPLLIANLAAFATFPLVGGLLFTEPRPGTYRWTRPRSRCWCSRSSWSRTS